MKASTNKKIAIGFSFLLVIGLALYLTKFKDASMDEPLITRSEPSVNTEATTENKTPSTEVVSDKQEVVESVSGYKDGTYNAIGVYSSPAGREEISISITISKDVVTGATFSGDATNPTSKNKQNQFAANFKQKVVGKSIDSISLNTIGGASLTTDAFIQALAKIKLEAKA